MLFRYVRMMKESMGKAIGIDLGTTNSCAAIVESGKPGSSPTRAATTTIPSVFAIDEKGNRLVGHEAKRQGQLNPTNTVAGAKRLIGRNFHSKTIDKMRQVFTYELRRGRAATRCSIKVAGPGVHPRADLRGDPPEDQGGRRGVARRRGRPAP